MSSSAGHRQPECHVLNFFFDKHDGSALTVFSNNVRFHIIADASKFKADSGPDGKLAREYRALLAKLKEVEDDYTRPCSKENLRSGARNSQDSGHGSGDDNTDSNDDTDSAVNVSANGDSSKQLLAQAEGDPGKALNDWMLRPFGAIFEDKAPKSGKVEEQSVADWYRSPMLFYELEFSNGELRASELEATEELEKRAEDVVPRMNCPKYIRTDDIPWYPADQVMVLAESAKPPPYHPSRVQVDGQTFFLKMVDPSQPSPTKREINLMRKAEKLDLHKEIRIPLVKGLVGFEESKTEMMGFLQTEIEEPEPLTHLLDSDVPQAKRDKWATESERMKDVLHEHGIVWGDAKADNFIVDKHDNLWIIDFGGSYTDGWIDPELMETQAGDDMGVDRIVKALHNPDAETWDPEEANEMPYAVELDASGKKRKVSERPDEEEEHVENDENQSEQERPLKRVRTRGAAQDKKTRQRKHDHDNTERDETDVDAASDANDQLKNASAQSDVDEGPKYCFCNKPSDGKDMIACDGEDCKKEWFHFECVGLKEAPKSKKWYCKECKV